MLGALQRAHHYHRGGVDGGRATTRAQATVEQGDHCAELVERLRDAVQANEDQQEQLVQERQRVADAQQRMADAEFEALEAKVRLEAAKERIEELDDALEERSEKLGSAKADALAQQARAEEAIKQVQMLTAQLLRPRGCSFCSGPPQLLTVPPTAPWRLTAQQMAAGVAPAPQGAHGPPFAPKTPTGAPSASAEPSAGAPDPP